MTEAELLDAILAHPEDMQLRRVYGDFLQQQGDVRGEFVSVECELAGEGLSEQRREELADRRRALWAAHADEWLRPLGLRTWEGSFEGGLVSEVSLHRKNVLEQLDTLRRCPIRRLRLSGWDPPLRVLLSHPTLQRLVQISLTSRGLTDPDLACLDQLPELEEVALFCIRLEDEDLSRSPYLRHLTRLVLKDPIALTLERVLAVLASPHLPRLTSLRLVSAAFGPQDLRQLARSPHLQKLTELHLGDCAIGPEGAQALASSPHLQGLTHLGLVDAALGAEGARALARSPYLQGLTHLHLTCNQLGNEGVLALASAPHLGKLTELILDNNGLGENSARALAESRTLQPTCLFLINNLLGAEGARILASSPRLNKLIELYLPGNRLGNQGAIALARSPHLQKLRHLDLGANQLGDKAAYALISSPRELYRLGLYENPRLDQRSRAALQARFGAGVYL